MKHPVLMTNQIDFHCFRCGVYIDSGDVWQTHCDRCQQLAALEAEIGRAVIAEKILGRVISRLEQYWWRRSEDEWDGDALDILHDKHKEAEAQGDFAMSRYRELLAVGAEAAQGGEEAG